MSEAFSPRRATDGATDLHASATACGGSAAQADAARRRMVRLACVAGVVMRVLVLLLINYATSLQHDAGAYDRLGLNLAQRGIYSLDDAPPFTPTVLRAPLTPLFLAGCYRIFGHHHLPVQLAQIALNVAACLLLYRTLVRLAPGIALPALWLMMLCPFDPAYCGSMLSEPLCGISLVAAFAAPVLLPTRFGWLVSGLALGAAALGRDVYLLLVPSVAVVILLFDADPDARWARLRSAGALLLGAIIVIAPWTVRNWRVSGELIPISNGLMGFNLWVGTWERNSKWASSEQEYAAQAFRGANDKAEVEFIERLPESTQDAAFLRLAWRRFAEHPGYVMRNWVQRWWQLWLMTRVPFPFRPSFLADGSWPWKVFKGGIFLLNFGLVALAAFGLVNAARAQEPILWLALPIAYTGLVYLPFHSSEARYSQPVFVFILVFATLEICRLVARQDCASACTGR